MQRSRCGVRHADEKSANDLVPHAGGACTAATSESFAETEFNNGTVNVDIPTGQQKCHCEHGTYWWI
jgi:hypothetical protein